MLLLRAPSRRRDDIGITLRAPAGCQRIAAEMADIAMGSACPPDVAERVRTCIYHSGRYDCRVSAAAAYFLVNKPKLFEICDGSIEITDRIAA